jgi:NADH-quinone oxidoreductase subunit H
LISWFQARIGPNRVGPLGLLQPAADGVKLAFKEDIEPHGADIIVYRIAPLLKVVPVLVVLAAIPLGPDLMIPWFDGNWYQVPLVLADINVGVLWLMAITSVGTYGIVLAGWASNNKYAMLGGLRASAQMISYELSLGLTMAVPVMIVGSMNLTDIAAAQPMFWNWFFLQNPLAAGILMVALLAEVSRSPFDLPEAEQELTAGFMTEYSGMRFAAFMMGEYLGMIAISMIAASLFFGGYQDGFGLVNAVPILGPLVMGGKVFLMLCGMIWVRATLPRIRYDRLMHFGWKIMLPLAMLAVAWSGVSLVIGDLTDSLIVYGIAAGIFFVIVLGGAYLMFGRAGTAAERAETDSLADDPMVTGEQRGLGWGVLNVVGGLLGGLFSLYQFTLNKLDAIASVTEQSSEKALAVKDESSKQVKPSGD